MRKSRLPISCIIGGPVIGFFQLLRTSQLNSLSVSHTRANWQAESLTSYELGWFPVTSERFPVHSRQVGSPTEIVNVCSVGQWQEGQFFSGAT